MKSIENDNQESWFIVLHMLLVFYQCNQRTSSIQGQNKALSSGVDSAEGIYQLERFNQQPHN